MWGLGLLSAVSIWIVIDTSSSAALTEASLGTLSDRTLFDGGLGVAGGQRCDGALTGDVVTFEKSDCSRFKPGNMPGWCESVIFL